MPLILFPARSPIGTVELPDGTELDVIMTPEFVRALADLMVRVGGAEGMDFGSIEIIAGLQPPSALPDQPESSLGQVSFPPLPVGQTADQLFLSMVGQTQDILLQTVATVEAARAEVSVALQRIGNIEAQAQPIPLNIDLSRPGAIGGLTASPGSFSTLSSSGTFGCNAAAPQTSAVLPAAAIDLPTGLALINAIRTALINNGIGI